LRNIEMEPKWKLYFLQYRSLLNIWFSISAGPVIVAPPLPLDSGVRKRCQNYRLPPPPHLQICTVGDRGVDLHCR
jgi:hypothetical protein